MWNSSRVRKNTTSGNGRMNGNPARQNRTSRSARRLTGAARKARTAMRAFPAALMVPVSPLSIAPGEQPAADGQRHRRVQAQHAEPSPRAERVRAPRLVRAAQRLGPGERVTDDDDGHVARYRV